MKMIHDTFTHDSNLRQLRDRALLEVGWFAALECEALAGLHVDDIQRFNGGSTWAVRIRKDRKKGTTTEPILLDDGINVLASVDEWCDAAGIKVGPIFRLARGSTVGHKAMSGAVVTRTVKKYVELVGLDPADYSANSLRHGPVGFGG
jgi:site-specific recombinase XerD